MGWGCALPLSSFGRYSLENLRPKTCPCPPGMQGLAGRPDVHRLLLAEAACSAPGAAERVTSTSHQRRCQQNRPSPPTR